MASVTILSIESSCDDTSAAVCTDGNILANIVAGQDVHTLYGGVVPELASRAHMAHIVPVVSAAMKKAGIAQRDISAVAFTQGPGLLGSLLVGASFAKSFAQALGVPIIAVHHMQAHIVAHFIDEPKPAFPFLCLTVSGGHTQIVLVRDHLDMEILGETKDDAAGEAFDKAAKMLGLPYPGGPLIDQYAKDGNPHRFSFPEPTMGGYDFSFSGLKTSVLYFLRDQTAKDPGFIAANLPDICASIQYRIVSILLGKLRKAAQQTGIKEVALAGGVSANSSLRSGLLAMGAAEDWKVYIPAFEFCTDNAAMIAMTGYFKYLKGDFAGMDVVPMARLEMK
jgi:N6-L-threonylcarbamoyladenine synthase